MTVAVEQLTDNVATPGGKRKYSPTFGTFGSGHPFMTSTKKSGF